MITFDVKEKLETTCKWFVCWEIVCVQRQFWRLADPKGALYSLSLATKPGPPKEHPPKYIYGYKPGSDNKNRSKVPHCYVQHGPRSDLPPVGRAPPCSSLMYVRLSAGGSVTNPSV